MNGYAMLNQVGKIGFVKVAAHVVQDSDLGPIVEAQGTDIVLVLLDQRSVLENYETLEP
jgi:hypothetical protein